MIIRKAELKDVPQMMEIYNDAVLHTTTTFDLEAKTLEDRLGWFHKYNEMYPLIVAELDGKAVGYCCLSPFREKGAYKQTVEISVYVHKNARGNGIARKLIERILELAKEAKHHAIIAGITGGNDISIKLHKSFGFSYIGTFREVGFKFGEWRDVSFYQLLLES